MSLIVPNAPQFSRFESNIDGTPDNTPGTTVTHNGVAHTKNATWTELIASTAFEAQLLIVTVSNNQVSNTDSSTLLDIGIGASTAETAIISDMAAGWVTTTAGVPGIRNHYFPLRIPSSSRISARTQSIRTTGDVTVLVQLFGGPKNPDAWWCGTHVTTYGANAANSAGTKFTPGNGGAEGTGVAIGTTSAAHKVFVLGLQGHPDDASLTNADYHLDFGIDSSSTQWVATDYWHATISSVTDSVGPAGTPWMPVYMPLPSGTVLMVRGEGSGTSEPMSAVIHGIS